MFFFGLLSTHLPYIILGIIYLVSFSLYSYRVLSEDENKNPEHTISCEARKLSIEKDTEITYIYSDYFEIELAEPTEKNSSVQKPLCPEKKIRILAFNKAIQSFYHYHPGFCRPPPPVFLS